jgi:hypothetical protein
MRLFFQLYLLTSCFVIISSSCKSNKYTPENPSPSAVYFGSGGGFTGAVTEYLLCENGQMFVNNSLEDKWKKLESISKKEANELFENTLLLDWKTLELNDPGNFSYFIRLKNREVDKKIVWGGSAPPADIQLLYTKLNLAIRLKN